jgi:hypothetical protein
MVANNHDHPVHRSINDLILVEPREQKKRCRSFRWLKNWDDTIHGWIASYFNEKSNKFSFIFPFLMQNLTHTMSYSPFLPCLNHLLHELIFLSQTAIIEDFYFLEGEGVCKSSLPLSFPYSSSHPTSIYSHSHTIPLDERLGCFL